MTEEVSPYLGLSQLLHILLVSVDTATRFVKPDYRHGVFIGSVCVLAGEIAEQAFRAQDKDHVD